MNIMNCFSKTQFSLLSHPIFLSFACFGMFHFRNSKFLNETGTSNKTSNFPNILFQFCFFCFALGVPGGLCFCVSEGCEPGSSNATILGMPGSIPMIKQNIQHPKQKKHPHCEVKLLPCRMFSFYSGNLGIPSRVLGDLFQISSLLFPRVR